MRRRPLKPWHGLVFFLLIMAVFFVICVPMQMLWGLYGLAATEILILLLSLAAAKLLGYPLKVLFPVKRPSAIPLLGTCVLWLSSYLLTMVLMLVQYRLFPEQMEQVGSGLNDVIFSGPFLISVIIVSVLPAVCEEAVHRGIIIHTLYPIRREWVVVLIMGLYFGFFHSDPFRFLPTAVLGAVMSYIMLETENMVYSSAFHGINNLLPMVLQQILLYGANEEMVAGSEMSNVPIVSIGIYMVFAAVAPFGMYLGNYMLHHQKGVERKFISGANAWKKVLGIVIPTAALFGVGIFLVIYGILFDPVMQEMIQDTLHYMN